MLPLSIHFGSAQSTSDLNFSQTEGVSFTRLLKERFPIKKRISQVLTPNNVSQPNYYNRLVAHILF